MKHSTALREEAWLAWVHSSYRRIRPSTAAAAAAARAVSISDVQHAPGYRLGMLRPYVCVCFQLISNCVQLQRACSLHAYNAMEKGRGTDISTHEDTRASLEGMRASAPTMEAPGSASVGDGTAAAVDWGSRREGGVYVWSWALGKVGLERWQMDEMNAVATE